MTTSHVTRADRVRRRYAFYGVFLALLATLLLACSQLERTSRVEIGILETDGLNSTEAHFQTLSGRKAWAENLEEGDTLSLTYKADVEKGALILQVENPDDEVIWQRDLEESDSVDDQVELIAGVSGTYTIRVEGEGAGGNYELAWDQIQ